MVKGTGQMYITGPAVIKSVTGEEVDFEELGGAMTHATRTGNCHFVADNDQQCLEMVRRLLSFLPQNNVEEAPYMDNGDDPNRMDEELLTIIPDSPNKVYDMKQVISKVTDNGDFIEVHSRFGRSLIVGFARLGGYSVGIVAQQPSSNAG